jgi:hypothetical protein
MLSVYEQLFLLALDEEKGNFLSFTKKTISYGLAGALIADLAILGAVCVNEKHRLEAAEGVGPVEDDLLNETLKEIQASEKPRKLPFWIAHLKGQPKKLRTHVGETLAARNRVLADESRFYWPAQTRPLSVENWPGSKFELKFPMRSAIFTEIEPDYRSLAVLNIAAACNLLNLIFTEDELSQARSILREKVMHAALQNPSLQTIEAIGHAIGAAIDDESEQ